MKMKKISTWVIVSEPIDVPHRLSLSLSLSRSLSVFATAIFNPISGGLEFESATVSAADPATVTQRSSNESSSSVARGGAHSFTLEYRRPTNRPIDGSFHRLLSSPSSTSRVLSPTRNKVLKKRKNNNGNSSNSSNSSNNSSSNRTRATALMIGHGESD